MATITRMDSTGNSHILTTSLSGDRAPAQHDLRDRDQQVDEQDDRTGGVQQEQEHRVRRDRGGDHAQEADDAGDQDRGPRDTRSC